MGRLTGELVCYHLHLFAELSGLACMHTQKNMGGTMISALGGVHMKYTQEGEEAGPSRVSELEAELKLEREYSDQLEEELGDVQQRSNNLRELLLEAQDNLAEAEANELEISNENERLHAEIRRLSM